MELGGGNRASFSHAEAAPLEAFNDFAKVLAQLWQSLGQNLGTAISEGRTIPTALH